MKILYNSVNYEDGWRKKEKKVKNLKIYCYFIILPRKFLTEGYFYLITNTPKYSTIVLNSVNDTQDFMCIEYKAFLPCKQHPTVGA